MDNPTFNAAYKAHQPPAVQAFMDLPFEQRLLQAQSLVDQGHIIDTEIMVYGWSAFLAMGGRAAMGLTWWPSYGQPQLVLYSTGSNILTDLSHPFPNSIVVSTDIAQYPPFTPPPPPLPTPVDAVGADNGNGTFSVIFSKAWNSTTGRWEVDGVPLKEGSTVVHNGQLLYWHLGWFFVPEPMWLTQAKWDSFRTTGTI